MIKSVFINSLLISLAALLQSTLLHKIAVYGVVPDIVLVLVLFISLKESSRVGELSGFFGGLSIDFLSLSPLGFHGLIYCLIGFLTGLPSRNISTESLMTQILFVLTSLTVKYVFSTMIIILFSIESTTAFLFNRTFFLELAYTILITPLFFTAANKIYYLTHRKRVGL